MGPVQVILLNHSPDPAKRDERSVAIHSYEGAKTWIASSFFLVPLGGIRVRMF